LLKLFEKSTKKGYMLLTSVKLCLVIKFVPKK